MAPRTAAKKGTRKVRDAFSDAEKSAMRARVRETQAGEGEGENAVLEKIDEMSPADRAMAHKVHGLVKATAPNLSPRLWYGMPAYSKDGKLLCHFQPAQKFKTRYATLGFSDAAKLDEGGFWPVAYALKEWNAADEAKIRALLKKAIG